MHKISIRKAVNACYRAAVIITLLSFIGMSVTASAAVLDEDGIQLQVIWTEQDENIGKVLFSRFENEGWTVPLLLHETSTDVFHAVSCAGNSGEIYAVWTQQKHDHYTLIWTKYERGKWKSPEEIHTGLSNNRSSTLMNDADGTLWLAWTSTEGKYTDVYISYLQGNSWSRPKKVHPDNNVPDIEPQLSFDGGHGLILSYQTIDNHEYVTVAKRWTGAEWERMDSNDTSYIAKSMDFRSNGEAIYPSFIEEQFAAHIFIKKRNGALSIPLSKL